MPKKGRKIHLKSPKIGRRESKLTPEDEIRSLKAELKTKNEEIEDLKKQIPEIPTKMTQTTQTTMNTLVKSTQTTKFTLVQSTQTTKTESTSPKAKKTTSPKSTKTPRPKPPKKPSFEHTIWNDNALKCFISNVRTFLVLQTFLFAFFGSWRAFFCGFMSSKSSASEALGEDR